jgi:hypothetical protein
MREGIHMQLREIGSAGGGEAIRLDMVLVGDLWCLSDVADLKPC